MEMIWWNVYLDGKLIDEVPFTNLCDKDEIRIALINHDGYDPNIVIKRQRTKHGYYRC